MNELLVLSTTDNMELAKEIAFALVQEREAACVNIVPSIRSIFFWEGKVNEEGEFLLCIKTSAGKFESVRSRICSLHSYKVPEVIAIPITGGDPRYLQWLRDSVAAPER
jgi:periplasmic divalent cation tolerance protein